MREARREVEEEASQERRDTAKPRKRSRRRRRGGEGAKGNKDGNVCTKTKRSQNKRRAIGGGAVLRTGQYAQAGSRPGGGE